MPVGAIIAVVLLVSLGGGLVLYWLVAAERDQRQVMDREAAEQVARRDTTADGRNTGTDAREFGREK